MAFEFPTDLIRRVQITLRNDAGLSSYDPPGPTLPSVAGTDPSPAYPLCKHCKGRLLCGLQSLICVYCGEHQKKGDVSLEPISFKSTFGCQFLLQSLGLNGSEMIGVPIKGSELSNKGPIIRRKRIPLSEFLDVQIKRPDRSLKPESNMTNDTQEHSTSLLNFTGVDLDDFFPGSKNDTVHNSHGDQSISNQNQSSESKPVASQNNFSLFQNLQPSKTAVSSSDDVDGDSFTGWAANFQSADSGNQHEGSKSVDSFIGSTSAIDLSGDMDSVFGREKAQLNSNAKGNADWFQDNQRPTDTTSLHENNMINEGEDPFDASNDFTSSTGAQDPSKNEWRQTGNEVANVNEHNSEINLFDSTNNFQEVDFWSFSQADLFSGSSSHQSGSAEVNNFVSEDHTSDRIGDAKNKASEDTEQATEKGDIVNVPTRPSDGAETIATEMHNFSFMLDSNLSVPSKTERLSSFSQD